MKLHCFYIKQDEIKDPELCKFIDINLQKMDFGDNLYMYAYTKDKKIANEFKKLRNMDKFIYNIIRNVTKEQYEKLIKDIPSAHLTYFPLTTRVSDGLGHLTMPLTDSETIILDDEGFFCIFEDSMDLIEPMRCILPIISKEWRKKIGWDTLNMIHDIMCKISIGEYDSCAINYFVESDEFNIMMLYFKELFI